MCWKPLWLFYVSLIASTLLYLTLDFLEFVLPSRRSTKPANWFENFNFKLAIPWSVPTSTNEVSRQDLCWTFSKIRASWFVASMITIGNWGMHGYWFYFYKTTMEECFNTQRPSDFGYRLMCLILFALQNRFSASYFFLVRLGEEQKISGLISVGKFRIFHMSFGHDIYLQWTSTDTMGKSCELAFSLLSNCI